MALRGKKKKFVQVFEKKACNIAHTCKAMMISRGTYYLWIEKDPEFRTAVDECRESMIDDAETMLQKKIADGDTAATIFMLKTRGKSRGYVEKYELEHGGSDAFLEAMKEASKLRRQMKNEQD